MKGYRAAFLQHEGYLTANNERAQRFAARLARHKSIPLQLFRPLAPLRDCVAFVSVQNRDSGAQAAHSPWLDLIDFQRDLLDLADTAALIDTWI